MRKLSLFLDYVNIATQTWMTLVWLDKNSLSFDVKAVSCLALLFTIILTVEITERDPDDKSRLGLILIRFLFILLNTVGIHYLRGI